MITHPDTMLGKKQRNIGKRFSQFLTKIFWHLNQQPAPICPSTSRNCSTSSLAGPSTHQKCSTPVPTRSVKKNVSKSAYKNSSLERTYIRSQYPPLYRTCSMRGRTSTLTSIQEE